MNNLKLAGTQIRAENRTFWRNPSAAIFTVLFPVLFVMIGKLVGADKDVPFNGNTYSYPTLLAPGVIAYGVFSACFVSLGIRMAFLRDMGVLKRVRGTPIPTFLYLLGQIGTCVWVSLVLTVTLMTATWLVYGLAVPWSDLAGIVVALAFGAITFCSLALAFTGFIANGDAAPPLVNAAAFPQMIFGNVFFPLSKYSGLLWTLAGLTPLARLSHALQMAYTGQASAGGFSWSDLGVLAIWLVIGIVLAVKFFRWENAKQV